MDQLRLEGREMGFVEAVRTCLRKYVDFTGRAARAEYWWFVLFCILVGFVAGLLDAVVAPGFVAAYQSGPLGMLSSLALLLPSLAVCVRRLHDLDRTGWWSLALYAATLVLSGAIAAAFALQPGVSILLGLMLLAILVVMIVWLATKGTTGPNRFGPDPLTPGA